jgi:hypothetical protein
MYVSSTHVSDVVRAPRQGQKGTIAMAKKRRVKCPYCDERAEERTVRSGKTETSIYHWLDCALANCGHDPKSRVKDCPLEMIGINHGALLFSRPRTTLQSGRKGC